MPAKPFYANQHVGLLIKFQGFSQLKNFYPGIIFTQICFIQLETSTLSEKEEIILVSKIHLTNVTVYIFAFGLNKGIISMGVSCTGISSDSRIS